MNVRIILILALSFMSCHEKPSVLYQAADYLWSQQAADGGWHSQKHGIMKDGQAHTPFVLFALLQVPDIIYPTPEDKVQKALAYIRRNTNESGALGLSNPHILEYPNYATSYALRVLVQNNDPADRELIRRMAGYLHAQQFDEDRGIPPYHSAYGSWGFGETNLSPGTTGHVDISHTRKILEALNEAGLNDSVGFAKASGFLALLQNFRSPESERSQAVNQTAGIPDDGGFYITPVIPTANKGGWEPDIRDGFRYRSYATATCDGILALLATGAESDDPRVVAALNWLERHPELAYPDGIPKDHPGQWRSAMVLYHLWVRSEVYHRLDQKGNWKEEIPETMNRFSFQQGGFSNPLGAANKEDDPLLATAMAVMTMVNCGYVGR